MCIRDRFVRLRQEIVGAAHELHVFLAGWLRRQRVQIGRVACLLYTSDAADERSSVDLGGRRIIKKKNPRAHEDYQAHQRTLHNAHTHEIMSKNTEGRKGQLM